MAPGPGRPHALVTLLLLALLLLPGCLTPREEPAPTVRVSTRDEARLSVGLLLGDHAPLQEYNAASRNFEGYSVEVTRAIAEALGLTPRFRAFSEENLSLALEAGTVALALYPTALANGTVPGHLSHPILHLSDSVLVPEGSPVARAEDLRGARVGVLAGSSGETWALRELVMTGLVPGENLYRYSRLADAHEELRAGRTDAVVAGAYPQAAAARAHPSLRVAFEVPTREPLGLIVRDAALLDAVNGAIAGLEADGTLEALREEHLRDLHP
ncbi:MAG TPA: ABC transporter substrate-binding protein [Candidatus Thermoplasmatota archaeon]|nr:ABC transporter substrate-binding protein [Candidatus Thermoplasmatota archaeon]